LHSQVPPNNIKPTGNLHHNFTAYALLLSPLMHINNNVEPCLVNAAVAENLLYCIF